MSFQNSVNHSIVYHSWSSSELFPPQICPFGGWGDPNWKNIQAADEQSHNYVFVFLFIPGIWVGFFDCCWALSWCFHGAIYCNLKLPLPNGNYQLSVHHFISLWRVFVLLQGQTFCFMSFGQLSLPTRSFPLIPWLLSFFRNHSWETLSKAFWKSSCALLDCLTWPICLLISKTFNGFYKAEFPATKLTLAFPPRLYLDMYLG